MPRSAIRVSKIFLGFEAGQSYVVGVGVTRDKKRKDPENVVQNVDNFSVRFRNLLENLEITHFWKD